MFSGENGPKPPEIKFPEQPLDEHLKSELLAALLDEDRLLIHFNKHWTEWDEWAKAMYIELCRYLHEVLLERSNQGHEFFYAKVSVIYIKPREINSNPKNDSDHLNDIFRRAYIRCSERSEGVFSSRNAYSSNILRSYYDGIQDYLSKVDREVKYEHFSKQAFPKLAAITDPEEFLFQLEGWVRKNLRNNRLCTRMVFDSPDYDPETKTKNGKIKALIVEKGLVANIPDFDQFVINVIKSVTFELMATQ